MYAAGLSIHCCNRLECPPANNYSKQAAAGRCVMRGPAYTDKLRQVHLFRVILALKVLSNSLLFLILGFVAGCRPWPEVLADNLDLQTVNITARILPSIVPVGESQVPLSRLPRSPVFCSNHVSASYVEVIRRKGSLRGTTCYEDSHQQQMSQVTVFCGASRASQSRDMILKSQRLPPIFSASQL
jgi:hypothetical protein